MSGRSGKWCCSCRQYLPAETFRANLNNRNGLDSWCRACHAEAVREWRAKNSDYLERYNARRRAEYRDASADNAALRGLRQADDKAGQRARLRRGMSASAQTQAAAQQPVDKIEPRRKN